MVWGTIHCVAISVKLTVALSASASLGFSQFAPETFASAAHALRSAVYRDLVVNGIAPDGTVDWGAGSCISALREAQVDLAVDGWASLDAAIAWIGGRYSDQTPEGNGCRTWPQVIHESRRFELRFVRRRTGAYLGTASAICRESDPRAAPNREKDFVSPPMRSLRTSRPRVRRGANANWRSSSRLLQCPRAAAGRKKFRSCDRFP